MRFGSRMVDEEATVNLTPLIDVVFLLLIFFMVSTTFDTTSQLKINLPEASAEKSKLTADKLRLLIDAKGRFFINGKELQSQKREVLLLEIQRVVRSNKEMPVLIQSDAKAPVQSLITAMDVVGHMGLRQLSIATTQPLN